MKKIINKLKEIDNSYILLFFISLFLLFPLISKNYFFGDDTQYHVSNIDAIVKMISDFQFSKIVPLIGNDFGYGAGIFYPKLPHYFTAIIYLLIKPFDLNIFYSMKIAHFIKIFLSSFFMYRLLIKIFKDKKVSLIGSIFYITMPYYILDIYGRDAFAESFIFIFLPLILLGLYNLFVGNKKIFYYEFIIGYVGLVNSHLVLSVYYTVFLIILILVNYKKFFNRKNIICLCKASFLILIFIMPFIIPMLEHKRLNIYGVFDPIIMGTNADLLNIRGLSFKEYFSIEQKELYFNINIVALLLSIIGILRIKKNIEEKEKRKFFYGIIAFTILSFILTSSRFDWKLAPEILGNIQFPWRLVGFSSFGICMLGALGFMNFKSNNFVYYFTIIFSLILSAFFINFTNLEKMNQSSYDISLHGMGWNKEYLPVNTIKNIDYFNSRDKNVKVLSHNNNVKVNIIKDSSPKLEFKVSNLEKGESVYLELPRIYYLGYDIRLDNNKVNYSMDKYGFIKLKVNDNGLIKVKYTGTLLYKVSIIIVLITLLVLYMLKKDIVVKFINKLKKA